MGVAKWATDGAYLGVCGLHRGDFGAGLPKPLHHHLVCYWVRPSHYPRYSNIQRDCYGFIVAKFNCMDGNVHSNSFAFPLHCQQVFFSNNPTRPGWKIVCWIDVRGRRGQTKFNQSVPAILEVGNDGQFVGLQPRVGDVEPMREPVMDGDVCIPQGAYDRMPHPHEETE